MHMKAARCFLATPLLVPGAVLAAASLAFFADAADKADSNQSRTFEPFV